MYRNENFVLFPTDELLGSFVNNGPGFDTDGARRSEEGVDTRKAIILYKDIHLQMRYNFTLHIITDKPGQRGIV